MEYSLYYLKTYKRIIFSLSEVKISCIIRIGEREMYNYL